VDDNYIDTEGVSSYVFPIYVEVIQVPLLTIVVVCEAYSKDKKE
jgi:hypothetical protein